MRKPFVTHCSCCNQPVQLDQYDPMPGRIAPKWLVKCLTPGCGLGQATFTDVDYVAEVADHHVTQHPDWKPISACTAG